MGVTVGLPLLDAMAPSEKAIAAAKNSGQVVHPNRMAFVFVPNGVVVDEWKPKGETGPLTLSKTLSPLAAHKDSLVVFTGLAQDNGRPKGDGPGDHARSASTFLTGAHPYKTSGANIRVGMSADQAAAFKIGHQTKLPSLELGIEPGRNAGNCDSGYSCAYSSNISWKSETMPQAKEVNPKLAFERMFGGGKEEQLARKERDFYRKSILDVVATDAAKLKSKLGQTDRRKIDEYFSSVREIEERIARAEKLSREAPPEFKTPKGTPAELQDHIRLMYDLLAVAFQTDSTRIATFMLANAGSNRAYRMVNVNDGHHGLSHHQKKVDNLTKIQKIDQFLVTQHAYFLDKLASIREGEGTLLDHSMIVYGSGLSDGDRHNHDDLPIFLAGKGGGTIKTGRHVKLKHETPLNNLFLSMFDRAGATGIPRFGDSTGRLKELDS